MMSGNTEELEPINLGGEEGTANPPPEDPWSGDGATEAAAEGETEPNSEEPEEPSDTAEALSKLKESSHRLASNLDQKLGLSGAFSALGNQVKQIDQQTHVSNTVKSASSSISGWFSSVDQKFQISEKGKELGSSIGQIVPTQEITASIQKSSRALKSFDESHGITKATANTLAESADFLSKTIGEDENGAPSAVPDQTDAVDGDGLPSSFQK